MLAHHRLDAERFKRLAVGLTTEGAEDNFVKRKISAPREPDPDKRPEAGSPAYEKPRELGEAALSERRVALARKAKRSGGGTAPGARAHLGAAQGALVGFIATGTAIE
jgi:hypothetical protein